MRLILNDRRYVKEKDKKVKHLFMVLAPVDQAMIKSLEERPDLCFWAEGDEHDHANFMGS